MRLYTFVTFCACALYVRAASIPSSEKKFDKLDNVDFDNVESDLVDQPTVQDLENNLRKVSDIPVNVVDEAVVLDESSNDYVPNKDENIVIKRVEIDLNNPGPPQRQEHETQNPENYGHERAVFAVIEKTKEAQSVFIKGLKEVSDSLHNIIEGSNELPVVKTKLKNLNESFGIEIEKLNDTIRSHLESEQAKLDGESKKDGKLKFVESKLQNLEFKFKNGVNALNEGIELLSIIREEDETIKTKALIKEENQSVKETNSNSTAGSTTQGPSNAISGFLSNFQLSVSNAFSNLTSYFQNSGNNPVFNFWQGLTSPTIIQGSGNQPAKPAGAQSDEPASSATPAQWGPQALYQQFQTSIQNLINPGIQQNQQVQGAAQQGAPSTGPILQGIQSIVQFIQRPGQAASQQPANPSSTSDTQGTPSKQPDSSVSADAIPPPVSASAESPAPAKADISQPSQPANILQAAPEQQQAAVAPEQPAKSGPIQQLVQNNPIIKGIQSAVQRLQGSPNSETPRNEIIENDKKEKEELENKGHYGGSNVNQGDTNDSIRVGEKIEEQKEEAPAAQEAAVEGIKAEETKPLTSSDKTE